MNKQTIKYASMTILFVTGAIMIYEGSNYIKMKQANPNISDKIYAAAVLAILLGVAEITFGVFHFFME